MAGLVLVVLLLSLLLLAMAHDGLLGERARLWVTELNEDGKREQVERRLHEADRASQADYLKARSAMNEAAGQGWRDLSEWRDD